MLQRQSRTAQLQAQHPQKHQSLPIPKSRMRSYMQSIGRSIGAHPSPQADAEEATAAFIAASCERPIGRCWRSPTAIAISSSMQRASSVPGLGQQLTLEPAVPHPAQAPCGAAMPIIDSH